MPTSTGRIAARLDGEPRTSRRLQEPHGKSWISILGKPDAEHWETVFASHTFHEIQMYYPMRVVRDKKYKLIGTSFHPLPYPFASDLWAASSFQAQFEKGMDAPYGRKTVGQYIHRPQFELYDMQKDRDEATNLAYSTEYQDVLKEYQAKLKAFQKQMDDPWIMKWDYEQTHRNRLGKGGSTTPHASASDWFVSRLA